MTDLSIIQLNLVILSYQYSLNIQHRRYLCLKDWIRSSVDASSSFLAKRLSFDTYLFVERHCSLVSRALNVEDSEELVFYCKEEVERLFLFFLYLLTFFELLHIRCG